MVADKVAKELRSALDAMKAERTDLDNTIQDLERLLSKYGGGVKRGPGRPPGSPNKKRGPGRPKGSKNKTTTTAKRGPGRPKGSKNKTTTTTAAKASTKKKKTRNWSPAAKKAAAERMKRIWADRRKKNK